MGGGNCTISTLQRFCNVGGCTDDGNGLFRNGEVAGGPPKSVLREVGRKEFWSCDILFII